MAFAHELPDVAEDVGRLRLWSCGASASDLVFLPDPSSILKPNLYRLAASLRVAQPTAIPEADPRILLALSLTRRLSTRTTRAPLAPAEQWPAPSNKSRRRSPLGARPRLSRRSNIRPWSGDTLRLRGGVKEKTEHAKRLLKAALAVGERPMKGVREEVGRGHKIGGRLRSAAYSPRRSEASTPCPSARE